MYCNTVHVPDVVGSSQNSHTTMKIQNPFYMYVPTVTTTTTVAVLLPLLLLFQEYIPLVLVTLSFIIIITLRHLMKLIQLVKV